MRNNAVLAIAAAALSLIGARADAQSPPPVEPFLGTWQITAVAATPQFAGLTAAQAAGLVRRNIEVTRSRAQIWAPATPQPRPEVCAAPEFLPRETTRAALLAEHGLRGAELTVLPARFAELTVTCQGNFFVALRLVSPDVMIGEFDSVFFRLQRAAAPPATAATQGGASSGGATQGPQTVSPSFDCAQARRPDEQIICADAGLARSDRAMAEAFRKAVAAAAENEREALRREQRDWVANRAKQCGIAADTRVTDANRPQFVRCLTGLYTTRIAALEARLQRRG
ncbi:MAG: DUF1311 domain-containing protein [Alphaproteobacteria bacterium]|nr:DUF1311 domain-containing protein [Alphaproteobacteria bacterium]